MKLAATLAGAIISIAPRVEVSAMPMPYSAPNYSLR